jgi:D-sedoheptulose 7-phosphate isomerase
MQADDRSFAAAFLARSAAAAAALAADAEACAVLAGMADLVVAAMRGGRKLMVAGNGGSAADAQHIAGEFISRLMFDRAPLPAIALTADSSALTASANDYGYEHVFARQVRGLAQRGDVFLGISTSGCSPNVLRALDAAREAGAACLGFTGEDGGAMVGRCALLFRAPARETPVVQQLHITAAHLFCALVERRMFPDGAPR